MITLLIILNFFMSHDRAPMSCNPSYPTLCIPINAADVDCKDLIERNFVVLAPDPHKLDKNSDGVGCEN